jgi:hypothetical protein
MSWTNFELCHERLTRMTALNGVFSTSFTESAVSSFVANFSKSASMFQASNILGVSLKAINSFPQLFCSSVSKFDFLLYRLVMQPVFGSMTTFSDAFSSVSRSPSDRS